MKKLPEDNFKRVLVKGTGDIVGQKEVYVTGHYAIFVEKSSKSFDSGFFRQKSILCDVSLPFPVRIGLKTMRKGEEAQFVIHSRHMFGDIGYPPHIKPHEDILLALKLTNIVDMTAELVSKEKHKFLNYDVNMAASIDKIIRDLKVRGQLKRSINLNNAILDGLRFCDQENQRDFEDKMCSHLFECLAKLEDWDKIQSKFDSLGEFFTLNDNSKALLYNGMAHRKRGDFTRAIELLQKAKKIDPHNELIEHELKAATDVKNENDESYKQFCKRMFKF